MIIRLQLAPVTSFIWRRIVQCLDHSQLDPPAQGQNFFGSNPPPPYPSGSFKKFKMTASNLSRKGTLREASLMQLNNFLAENDTESTFLRRFGLLKAVVLNFCSAYEQPIFSLMVGSDKLLSQQMFLSQSHFFILHFEALL